MTATPPGARAAALRLEDVLTDGQLGVLRRVVAEEGARREHLVVYLSGAHAYGFPSPDSDLDLKCVHIADSAALLGLRAPSPTADRMEVIDGVEVDYTSNELAHALFGILQGNGNFLERVLGGLTPYASPLLDELRPIVRRALCRRVHRHYRGFAASQVRFLEREPSVKKLLYVLRTSLTGIHLLEERELEPDLRRLVERVADHGLPDVAALIERKRAGERTVASPALLDEWRPHLDRLFTRLDEARDKSPLPDSPRTNPRSTAGSRRSAAPTGHFPDRPSHTRV